MLTAVGYAVFGGITPRLVSVMAHCTRFAPADYVAVVALMGLIPHPAGP